MASWLALGDAYRAATAHNGGGYRCGSNPITNGQGALAMNVGPILYILIIILVILAIVYLVQRIR